MFKKVKRDTRELVIRTSLLDKLKQVVQSLLQPSAEGKSPCHVKVGHSDNTNVLCCVIEAMFIHGLRDSLGEKMSSLFADPDRMPVPNFWPVVMIISHRDLLEEIEKLSFITSEVGRGRAWIRLALNDSQICSYLGLLAADNSTLKEYYRPNAFLRDSECCDIMLRILQPISSMTLTLATNAAVLNTWTTTPLVLSGVWIPPCTSQNTQVDLIMGATDVASTVFEPHESRGIPIPQLEEEEISDEMFNLIIGRTPETNFIREHAEEFKLPEESNLPSSIDTQIKASTESQSDNPKGNLMQEPEIIIEGLSPKNEEEHKRYTGSTISESLSRSTSIIPDAPTYTELLSEFDTQNEAPAIPSFLAQALSTNPNPEPSPCPEQLISSIDEALDLNFEVLPQVLLPEDSSELLPLLVTLTNEEGLDSQEFQCFGCKSYIGMLYGKHSVCGYDSRYYCNECHVGEVSIIPARVIHNWDFTSHPVCHKNKVWLSSIYHQPLIDLRTANPRIYRYIDDLSEMQSLRRQLLYLRAYILTCKSNAQNELRKKLWPKEYLYEHVHLYSLFDLQLLSTDQLVSTVRSAVVWGRKHVLACNQCAPRGFICEICNKDEVIYPFQIGNTYTCSSCNTVYHSTCSRRQSCPKCERLKMRKSVEDSGLSSFCED